MEDIADSVREVRVECWFGRGHNSVVGKELKEGIRKGLASSKSDFKYCI